ncbi:MAG TPA: S8 family peptidase [bacterium]|nr:S8 family peptidase [bacterium]HPR87856.1 S8 family peptidase [bacterium]
MKRALQVLGLAVLLMTPGMGRGETGRMDPRLFMRWRMSQEGRGAASLEKAYGGRIPVIASGRLERSEIGALGGVLRWQRGDMAILLMPAASLVNLAETPGVAWLESPTMAKPATDISIPEIGGIKARTATALSGKNVLIGIVDSGIDWRHEDFITAEGKTRIRAILDLSEPGAYYGGTIFTEAEINAALIAGGELTTYDYSGHGSHVAGIAAGDGSSDASLGTYAGVAPAAGLIVVKANRDPFVSEFSSDDQIIAIDFIDSVAAAAGLPCVINLSFGTTFGAHDGTSAVERFIDTLSGPGRIFIAAAGNEGDKASHARVAATGSGATVSFKIPAYTANPAIDDDYLLLDGWYDGSSQATITLTTPANETIGPIAYGGYYDKNTASGYVMVWNGFYERDGEVISGPNPFNRDKEIIIEISDRAGFAPASGTWQLKVSGNSEAVDFWLASETMSVLFVEGVSTRSTLTVPATGKSVIAVGAYTTRKTWKDFDGNNLTLDTKGTIKLGDVTEFSGAGPSRDNRTKPEITAPGRIIGSTLSADADPLSSYSVFASTSASYPNAFLLPDGQHGLSLGTSMAAPHVSGTVALLLEKKPDLTAAQARQLLISTARSVSSTAKANQWGYGKLDAYAAVTASLDSLPVTRELSYLPWPNPFTISTSFTYSVFTGLPEITVFNARGQRVPALLYRDQSSSGREVVRWYGQDLSQRRLAAGVYFFVFRYANSKIVRKVCLL